MRPLAGLLYQLNLARFWITRPLTLGVRVILAREGQVLLVQHTYQRGWLLPGGGVKRGETPEAAARREVWEEVGARLSAEPGALRLMGVYTNFYEYKSDHVVVFACEDFELAAQPKRSPEIECFDFFLLNQLPPDLMPGHRRRLAEYMQPGRVPGCAMW